MNPRLLLTILVAGGLCLVVVFATRSFLTNAQQTAAVAPPVEAPETTQILVAKRDLPIGTLLSAEDVELLDWPESALNPAYVQDGDTSGLYEGTVVRALLTAGEPITRSSLVKQGERGFLAAVLAPGMRAVTVNLTPVSSVGGFLFPGDRVDVILTHDLERDNGDSNIISETILQNVRVLAVDQRTDSTEQDVAVRRTATLEVTPRMAEKFALLERVGELSLSLRGLQAQADAMEQQPLDKTETYTFDADISNFINRPDSKTGQVRVRRGSNITDITTQDSSQGGRQ